MSQCLDKIHCKTLEFELEIDFDSLWQGYCTSPHFFFNTYSQGAPQIVKTQVAVKLRHTLRHSTCVSMSFGIIEPHKILGVPPWIRVGVASVLVLVLVVLVWLAVSASSSSTLTLVLPLTTSFRLALAGVVAFAFASTFA